MKALVLVACLLVGGCATTNFLTKSVDNPVTQQDLYNFENGLIVATAGLETYKQSCRRQLIPPSCQTVIARIQPYTRQVKPLLIQLRAFVKNNDQVNAIIAYNTAIDLMNTFKGIAAANNVKVQ